MCLQMLKKVNGEGGIRTRGTGLIPYNGLANRFRSGVTNCETDTCGDRQEQLGVLLGALASEIGPLAPDLVQVVKVWPDLSKPVKAGILAMVKAAGDTSE